MSWGIATDVECPECGFPLTMLSYEFDPPPIPNGHLLPSRFFRRDDFEYECYGCPECEADLESETVLPF